MNTDLIRELCLSLPHVTESVQWRADLVFKVGGKMFDEVGLETVPQQFSLKCTPEEFAELIELDGIAPAHYVARYHWVTITQSALSAAETRRLIRQSYDLVWTKLPKKTQKSLAS
ncbi:MAG: MmcQ/YjbR family DNA-binding protein [Acidobacteriota bacterium]